MKYLKLPTVELNKKLLKKIIFLKNKTWKYGVKSNLTWFEKNIKKNDTHLMLFQNQLLVGYVCFRSTDFNIFKTDKDFLLLDTFNIRKSYRDKGFGKKLILLSNEYIKKRNKKSILFCDSKIKSFYKKHGWKIKNKKNFFKKNLFKKKIFMGFNF